MSRTIFIGDVHGAIDELEALMRKLELRYGDRVVFVGDLVDKGPESLKVLRHARAVVELYPGSVVVSGNHEEKASRFFKLGKHVEPWVTEATDDDWEFIDSMPLTWHDPDLNIRVIHAGIFPALLQKHPDAFEKIEARGDRWRKGGGKVMNRARRMLRVRYVGEESGDMLALGENKPGDPFWADTYTGDHGMIIYGHSPWLDGEVRRTTNTIGIDTAAVFGGKLTAAVTVDGSEFEFVSVDSKRYAEPMKED